MQITLERSGGFTGMPLTIAVDSAQLPSDQAAQLHHWVAAANFFDQLPAASTPAQPDRFDYCLTVQEGDRRHSITFGEAAVPEPLRPLLSWLIARGGPPCREPEMGQY